jgi:hypothetical protein
VREGGGEKGGCAADGGDDCFGPAGEREVNGGGDVEDSVDAWGRLD